MTASTETANRTSYNLLYMEYSRQHNSGALQHTMLYVQWLLVVGSCLHEAH
jgi:hypothetical protein